MGGTEFLETSKVSQTVLARLMVSQIGHQLAGSVGGKVQKRDNGICPPFFLGERCPPALTLMPDTSVSPSVPLEPFNLLPWCWAQGKCV